MIPERSTFFILGSVGYFRLNLFPRCYFWGTAFSGSSATHFGRRPKARYAIVPNRLTNWIIPRLIPMRILDKLVARFMEIKGRPHETDNKVR
jgi:hypothetical protein